MSFFKQGQRLLHEFFKFKKYKSMHPALAVFSGIFLLFPAILFFFGIAFYFIGAIFFDLMKSPVEFLHTILRNEKKDNHPAPQCVIYWFAWPVVFTIYAFMAMFTLLINVQYFLAQVAGYIASMGGYRFHLLPTEENIEIGEFVPVNTGVQVVYIVASAILFLIGAILFLFVPKAGTVGIILFVIKEVILNCIYIPIAHHYHELEPAEEVPAEEKAE